MVVAALVAKKLGKEEVVSLSLLLAAAAPKTKEILSSSPSKDGENSGSKLKEDTRSMAMKVNPRVGHATNDKWKDLFYFNRSAENGTKLVHFSELNNVTSYSLLENDLVSLKDIWESCVLGYIAGKFPVYKALNNIITNSGLLRKLYTSI
ncbi:hypothetical protein OIU85_017079 [Salix viminalis]|uniref:Uncharacterized protein n=1 Tax=Salix viminalis TaxID=40686 RepID=A0A9Q0V746_SALVM|nr:hypothetical protein OIU85_017079 [Salix viminalis]